MTAKNTCAFVLKRALAVGVAALGLAAGAAQARDTVLNIPLADVLAMPEAEGKLDGSVKFYLAGAKTPRIAKRLGSDSSNQKTNGIGKSDEFGCKWAALSALIAFQNSAKRQGANAVVDIVSYYKKNETKSATTFECHAGGVIIGVALKGTYAKVAG
jgi:uncharacterized protein YbjQ (UPF0145 family)